jgi:hypothetical protein
VGVKLTREKFRGVSASAATATANTVATATATATATAAAILAAVFSLFTVAALQGQTAEIDSILNEDSVNWEQAARFVIPASGRLLANTNEAEAYTFAETRFKLPAKIQADSQITLAGLCYLLMKTFNIKGGLMFKIAPSPRYAYREFVKRGIVQGRRDPMEKVSGNDMLSLISRTEWVLAMGK